MTTMLNEKLPLTPGEWEMWGNPIKSKEYFEYILSYSPYNNLHKTNYKLDYNFLNLQGWFHQK